MSIATIKLQLALDGSLEAAFTLLQDTHRYIDQIEIGTPLVYQEGMAAVRKIKAANPDHSLLADLKIIDAGNEEAALAFAAGADYVTVLGVAADATVRGVTGAARQYGGRVMADLICVGDPVARGRQLLDLGCDVLCLHTAYDLQPSVASPLEELALMRRQLPSGPLAIAGGVNLDNVGSIVPYRPDIIVVGGTIARAADPSAIARAIKQKIAHP
jgi:3-hexulose-6-phosphate synthase